MNMAKASTEPGKSTWDYLIIDPPGEALGAKVVNPDKPPLVSFCIPTRNNPQKLENCLKSIVSQDYPHIEIVVVVNGVKDSSYELARGFTDLVYTSPGPLGRVRQLSVEKSRGVILALIDDDIVLPHPGWLRKAVNYFNYSPQVSTVWPRNFAPPGAPLSSRLYFHLWQLAMDDQIRRRRGLFGGGNALFRRDFLEEIGGVNTAIHWGEDYDWAKKLKAKGYQVVYSPDAIYHNTMDSLGQFVRKQFVGARTFGVTGFGLMNLSLRDVVFQQVVLGAARMARGLLKERDLSWSLWPVFLAARVLAYGTAFLSNAAKRIIGAERGSGALNPSPVKESVE